MFANSFDPENPLTPSELVFLNGEQFARKATLGNVKLVHSEEKLSLAQLAGSILAAGILACEQAGAFRLELQDRKAMLGLRKVRALYAVPANRRENLPEPSLEAAFAELAANLALQDKNTIYNMLYAWLRKDSPAPWNTVLELLKAVMAERGLMEATEEKKLKIFTVTHYALPERTVRLARGQSVEPVKALLDNCQRARPEVWKELEAGIKKAISARTQRTDTDFD